MAFVLVEMRKCKTVICMEARTSLAPEYCSCIGEVNHALCTALHSNGSTFNPGLSRLRKCCHDQTRKSISYRRRRHTGLPHMITLWCYRCRLDRGGCYARTEATYHILAIGALNGTISPERGSRSDIVVAVAWVARSRPRFPLPATALCSFVARFARASSRSS